VTLETPRWTVLSKNAGPVEVVDMNVAQIHGVANTTDVLNNCAFMVHRCVSYLHHSLHGNGLALMGRERFFLVHFIMTVSMGESIPKCSFKKPIALRKPGPAGVPLLTRVLSAHAEFKSSWRDRFSELRAAAFPTVISTFLMKRRVMLFSTCQRAEFRWSSRTSDINTRRQQRS